MKVLSCGPQEAVVVMNKSELEKLIGRNIGHGSYDHFNYETVCNVDWDLRPMLDSLYELKCLFEQVDSVSKKLMEASQKVTTLMWPAKKIEVVAAKEGKKK